MSDSAVTTDENPDDEEEVATDHLNDVPDGAGCVEIWEKINEARGDD